MFVVTVYFQGYLRIFRGVYSLPGVPILRGTHIFSGVCNTYYVCGYLAGVPAMVGLLNWLQNKPPLFCACHMLHLVHDTISDMLLDEVFHVQTTKF